MKRLVILAIVLVLLSSIVSSLRLDLHKINIEIDQSGVCRVVETLRFLNDENETFWENITLGRVLAWDLSIESNPVSDYHVERVGNLTLEITIHPRYSIRPGGTFTIELEYATSELVARLNDENILRLVNYYPWITSTLAIDIALPPGMDPGNSSVGPLKIYEERGRTHVLVSVTGIIGRFDYSLVFARYRDLYRDAFYRASEYLPEVQLRAVILRRMLSDLSLAGYNISEYSRIVENLSITLERAREILSNAEEAFGERRYRDSYFMALDALDSLRRANMMAMSLESEILTLGYRYSEEVLSNTTKILQRVSLGYENISRSLQEVEKKQRILESRLSDLEKRFENTRRYGIYAISALFVLLLVALFLIYRILRFLAERI